ncbi:MAG: hydrogenase [Candidatus Verstraetearchaeota archaeon]|jgi:NAD(P)H-flavin reductase|uniref:Hydrogenase n=1 Tax=Thermoproteota archaeon TaxID=2056631 RepID=A0A523BEB3_9CREN|nr:FAD/NAD(P)-binding protein [Candidatus Methanomethylicia archaeon]NHV61008.1 hydrogenase [Candidatus Verstraetearchaeota archaeon]TDA39255.1 MAG: hydrogenase [Candidatus Verstraetearchaeota archaeon]
MSIEYNPFLPRPAIVNAVRDESLETKTLKISLINWRANFLPGQFVQLLLPGVGEAPFCIASSPSDSKHIELTIMRRGLVTNAAHYMRPGDAVGIRGPFGRPFPVENFKGRDLVLVATGIGIAALRSLILYTIENRKDFGDITLLYGARFVEDLVYRDELRGWAEKINVIVTLSKPSEKWNGLKGRVTDHLGAINLGKGSLAVICGSPAVMVSVAQSLIGKGLDRRDVYLSMERHMKCGIGKCARCMIPGGFLVCKDGPVFSAGEISLEEVGE